MARCNNLISTARILVTSGQIRHILTRLRYPLPNMKGHAEIIAINTHYMAKCMWNVWPLHTYCMLKK